MDCREAMMALLEAHRKDAIVAYECIDWDAYERDMQNKTGFFECLRDAEPA